MYNALTRWEVCMLHKHSHHDQITKVYHIINAGIVNLKLDLKAFYQAITKGFWKLSWLIIYAAFYISIIAVIGLILLSTLISVL